MTPRNEVYAAIDTERDYQDRVWAENNPVNPTHPTDPRPLSIGEDILLMEEYLSRARTKWTGALRPELEALDIVRKVAGIAVRCMEAHGAPRR